jgi:hypothetical protein
MTYCFEPNTQFFRKSKERLINAFGGVEMVA